MICCDLIYVSFEVNDVNSKLKVDFWIFAWDTVDVRAEEVLHKMDGLA